VDSESTVLPGCTRHHRERPTGIEPASTPWQGAVLPLHHGRAEPKIGFEPIASPLPRVRSTKVSYIGDVVDERRPI
jgi:hypothetical protein